MSLEILIIPAALGVAAWQSHKQDSDDSKVVQMATRLKDPVLLREALEGIGAQVDQDEGITRAEWSDLVISFTVGQDDLLHAFSKDHDHEDKIFERIAEVDRTYARLVQRNVIERIRNNASGMGMRLESESVNDDDSVSFSLVVTR